MSDTILSGDFTVHYVDDNRRKQIVWSGSGSTKYTVAEVYSALGALFDDSIQMDDATPMSYQTPVEFTGGKIEPTTNDPWYFSFEALEHMNGGSFKTTGWARVTGSNTGIVIAPVTSNAILTADIGNDISGATTGNGTLLEVLEAGATDYLVIRPDSDVAGDDFTTASQVITCNAHTASQSGAVSFTGEMIWSNLYSIGNLEADTHIYIYRGAVADGSRSRVYSLYDSSQDWWGDGHLDVCVPITDHTSAGFPIIDGGYASVLARKYSTLFGSSEVLSSTVSGGRNPVSLLTSPDINNKTGYKSITFTASAGNWSVGDEINGDTSGARAIITKIDSPGSTQTIHYYLIDDPLTDFQTAAETLTNADDTGTGTKDGNAPADQGPALSTWFTSNTAPIIVFGNTTADIDNDGTDEGYAIHVDCNGNPLSEVYEWLKYITRRGNTSTSQGDGSEAEQYLGAEQYLEYSGSVSGGTIAEGDDVTQATSGATGIVMSHDTTLKQIILRSTRGTFATSYVVTSNDNSGSITPDTSAEKFSPIFQAPFGTFAGGKFFGARGFLISDWAAADENNFELTDSQGVIKSRPEAITITVSNLVGTDETTSTDDEVSVFRLVSENGDIDKTEYSAYGGEAIGAATLDVDTAIAVDVPGKTTGGVVKIRDASDFNREYDIRFSSWSNTGGAGTDGRFVLANIVIASADAGTNTTTVVKAGAFANAKRGDLVYNHTRNLYEYIKTVDSVNQITLKSAIVGQVPTDSIELNCIPIVVDTADDVYVPLIQTLADSTSEGVSLIYSAPIYFKVRVRNSRNSTKIIPYTSDNSTTGADVSIPITRTEDTVTT